MFDTAHLRAGLRWAVLASAALCLAACASGGGGGGGTGTAVASPTPTTPATPVVVAVGPSTTSQEFTRNYGVGAIHADAAWAQGASGKGIVVAVIDTGLDGTGPDLAGRASLASTDMNTSRNQITGPDRHGTYVSGIIASNFNGQGTVGVAFDSQIMSIRAETTGRACGTDNCFLPSDLAKGIDYAVARGAKIINMSFGEAEGPPGAAFEAALQRAVNAGVIVAAAAGNDNSSASNWPAAYSVDPRFSGAMIAVGSLNQAGNKSSFSNTAGSAAAGFMFAPGESIVTDCNGTTCAVVSGTSFAAPQVSGAMALLLQAFPNMTGRQVVDLLWRSARDLGAPGNDAVYGWGALDIQRAFSPVGTLSVPVSGGGLVVESLTPGAVMGAAFGDSISASGALRTVGWDAYQRPFQTDLGHAYPGARPSVVAPIPADVRRHSEVDIALAGGSRLNVAARLSEQGELEPSTVFHWIPSEISRDITLSFTTGRLGFTAWSGKASGNPFVGADHDPFTALAQSDHAIRADYAFGGWMMSAEAGGGQRRSPDLLQTQDGARYIRVVGRTAIGRTQSSFAFGQLEEPMGPLGAYIPMQGGFNLPSRTAFASWGGRLPLNGAFTLDAEASVGRTRLSGRFMRLEEPAWSSSWRVSLDASCVTFGLNCSSLRVSAAQPLRIEDGRFLARLPSVPADYFAPVTFTDRRFGAAPSGRQVDFTFTATQRTVANGALQLDAVVSTEPGHRAGSGPAMGMVATWRTRF